MRIPDWGLREGRDKFKTLFLKRRRGPYKLTFSFHNIQHKQYGSSSSWKDFFGFKEV